MLRSAVLQSRMSRLRTYRYTQASRFIRRPAQSHDVIYIITENMLQNHKAYKLFISAVTSSHSFLEQKDLFNPIIFIRAQMAQGIYMRSVISSGQFIRD